MTTAAKPAGGTVTAQSQLCTLHRCTWASGASHYMCIALCRPIHGKLGPQQQQHHQAACATHACRRRMYMHHLLRGAPVLQTDWALCWAASSITWHADNTCTCINTCMEPVLQIGSAHRAGMQAYLWGTWAQQTGAGACQSQLHQCGCTRVLTPASAVAACQHSTQT